MQKDNDVIGKVTAATMTKENEAECGQHASTEAGNNELDECASFIMQTIVDNQVPPTLLHPYLCIWVTLSQLTLSALYLLLLKQKYLTSFMQPLPDAMPEYSYMSHLLLQS